MAPVPHVIVAMVNGEATVLLATNLVSLLVMFTPLAELLLQAIVAWMEKLLGMVMVHSSTEVIELALMVLILMSPSAHHNGVLVGMES